MTGRRPLDRACSRRLPALMRRGSGRGGSGWSTQSAPPAESAVNALAPDYQFRADTVTPSGANVGTMPNRRGADALTVPFGTIAAPVANSAFGGAQTVRLSGAALRSNLPASAWNVLHKGDAAGYELFLVGRRVAETGSNQTLLTTRLGGADPGLLIFTVTGTSTAGYFASNNAGATIYTTSILDWATGAATYVNVSHCEADAQKVLAFSRDVNKASLTTTPPGTNDALYPLQIGNIGTSANLQGAEMELAEVLIFRRRLHEWQRQLVREYLAERYGIAAPVLTGVDRDLLSLMPFSTPRADYYATAVGKVTAWLDRARPGHSFSQATATAQVANPTPDSALLNALSAPFLGAQHYASNMAALSWAFMHSGAGFEAYDVLVPTNVSATSIVWGTYGAAPGTQLLLSATANVALNAYSAAPALIASLSDTGAVANGARAVIRSTIAAAIPQAALKVNGRSEVVGVLGTPSATAAPGSMRLGSRNDLAVPLQARWAETLWFDRVLTTGERAIVANYFTARYGGAP